MDLDKSRLLAVISSKALQELRDVTNGTTDSVIMTNEAISGLKQTIEEMQKEIDLLNTENQLLKQQQIVEKPEDGNILTEEQVSLIEEEWKRRLDEINNEKNELESKCESYERQIKEYDYENVERERNQFKEMIEQLEAEVIEIKKEGEKNTAHHMSYENELETNVKELQNQVEIYKNQVQSITIRSGQSSVSLNKMVEDNARQQQQIQLLLAQNNDLTSERDDLIKSVNQLQTTIRDSRNVSLRIEELTKDNNSYAQKNMEYQQEITSLKKTIGKIENANALELKKSLELDNELTHLKREIVEYKNTIAELQQQRSKEEEAKPLNEAGVENIEELIEYKEKLEHDILALKQQYDTLSDIEKMKSEELDKQRSEYEDKIREMAEEISEKSITIELKDSQIRKIKAQMDEVMSYSNTFESQIKDKASHLEELQNRLNEVEKERDDVIENNRTINGEFTNFKSSICSLLGVTKPNEAITKLNENLSKIVELIQLSESSVILQAQLENEKRKCGDLEERYRVIDEQLTHERMKTSAVARGQTDNAITAFQEENSRLISENKQMEKQIYMLKEQLVNQEEENNKLRLGIDSASRKQQIAANRSDRLEFFEFSHDETINFASTLSKEIETKLGPSIENQRRIAVLDKLSSVLQNPFANQEQVKNVWNEFRSCLFIDFMSPGIEEFKSLFESRAQSTFTLFNDKFGEMTEKLYGQIASIDMYFRTHAIRMPRRKKHALIPEAQAATYKQPFSFTRSPTNGLTPTRVPMERREKTATYFSRNRPNLSPRSIMGDPPSARKSFD